MNIDVDYFDKPREECAVFGVSVDALEAGGITYNGLLSMQHRGQEGAGIAVLSGKSILYHKDCGLVGDVFSGDVYKNLPLSKIAVGHNRYSTMGQNTKENVQPFVKDFLTGRIATAHNGNITNSAEIKTRLMGHGLDFEATSDSEIIASRIAYHSMRLEDAVKGVIRACGDIKGAFSLIVLSSENKLIAVRDPNGYRPLCIGENSHGIAVASESCALDSCGFDFLRDVLPGEVVVIQDGKIVDANVELKNKAENAGLCIFEYVYFARPDSVIDNLSVYVARQNMGRVLAREYPVKADIVCGVPDSGLEAAMGYSLESGIPLSVGFVKNRYIGRSFIYPSQTERESAVRLKLNPLRVTVENKKVVLVDDSIVRGTTSKKIIASMREAGAKEVHFRVSSPPFRFACYYGTDISNKKDLIANQHSIDEICKEIGADSLGYISIEGLKEACGGCCRSFCVNCFTGNNNNNG